MKKKAVAGTCLMLAGIAFVGLQIHWRLLAKSKEENPYTFLDAIRKGTIGMLDGNIVYIGDAVNQKDVRILTEQQFNTEFTESERRMYEQRYANARDLKAGTLLSASPAEREETTGDVIKDTFEAMVESPLSVINQPVYSPTPPPLPPRPNQILPIAEEVGTIPSAPPLPAMPKTTDEDIMAQPNNWLEQIRQGVPLKPVEKEERQQTLQDEIREGIKLRPASDRELSPAREKEMTLQDEIKQGVLLKPAGERTLAEKPAKPLTVLDEIRQFDKDTLKPQLLREQEQVNQFESKNSPEESESIIPLLPQLPVAEQSQNLLEQIREGHKLRPVGERATRPVPESLSEQDAFKQALREKFSSSEDDEEAEDMTPEEMGFIPSAPAYETIQPEYRPASNTGLLEQIRAGKQLKPVVQLPRPIPQTQGSAQQSLEEKVLQYQQTVPEMDESEYTESDWD